MRTSAFLLVLVFAFASAQSEGGADGGDKVKGGGKDKVRGGGKDKVRGGGDKSKGGGKLKEKTCAFGCSSACVWCTGLSTNDDGTRSVTIDASGCKGGAVSWFCAKGDGFTLNTCRGSRNDRVADEGKCENAASGVFTVTGDATTVTVQLHDGNQEGNVDCSVEECCGGGGGACGASGVCHHVVDLSTCLQPETPPTGCPAETPFEGCGICFATNDEALEC